MKNDSLRPPGPERGPATRAIILAVAGLFVLILVPWACVWLGGRLDALWGLSAFIQPPYNWVLGGLLVVAGWALGLWTVSMQVDQGRGTPVPLVPTRRLLTDGPYRFCRNPMTLGTIGLYKGIAVLVGSWGTAAAFALFFAGLFLYILLIEEKELAARFGQEYLEYKRRTAFIIPGVW